MTIRINQPNLSRRAALAAAGTLGALGLTVAAAAGSNAAPGGEGTQAHPRLPP